MGLDKDFYYQIRQDNREHVAAMLLAALVKQSSLQSVLANAADRKQLVIAAVALADDLLEQIAGDDK